MKVFVIPDIHLTNFWIKAAEDNIDNVDKMVFLGDYIDSENSNIISSEENYLSTLQRLKEFRNSHPDKVVLLCGNHDFSYIALSKDGRCVSNHQPNHIKIDHAFTDLLPNLHAAVEIDEVVYSHAGISKVWYENNGSPSFEQMDNMLHARNENAYNWNGLYDGYGNEPQQTPFWIRPEALIDNHLYSKSTFNMQFPKQVVGHTSVKLDKYPLIISNTMGGMTNIMPDGSWLCLTDSLQKNKFVTVIDGNVN